MKSKVPAIIFLFLFMCCFVPEVSGFDNASKVPQQVKGAYTRQSAGNFLGGHDTITAEGMLLKKQVHSGDDRFKQWADEEALQPLRIGAHDEDTNELLNAILRDPPLGPNGWGDFYRHFYDSRLGDDAENAIGPQAMKAVKDYLQKIRELTHCTSNGFESLPPGDKTKVYDYLGRITHLYQDMFCPSHVRVEAHPFVNPFEQYVNDRWREIVMSPSFNERVTVNAYLNGNYDIGISINPIQAMKAAAQKSLGFWGEEALCDQWDEQRSSCLLVNEEKLQQNVDALVPEAILSTAGYIDSIYRAAKAGPDYQSICVPKPLQGPGSDHPDDRFDVSDAFYWQDHFKLPDAEFTDLFMRTALKKGKTGVWYRKRLKELHERGRHSPSDMTVSEKIRIYNEFKNVSNKLGEGAPDMDWLTAPDIALFAYGFYNQAISLMLKIKESVRFLDLDFDPSVVSDHPVMLIPTAGFAGFEQSATLKAKLEEYVRSGGTIVVFAQQLGHHWNILPTPVDPSTGETKTVSGYGYQQDQNCQQGSVFIETNHAILSSFTTSSIDVGVDGYFSSYPDNSLILLRRTANGQPAMILYPYGNGYVLATTLYTDFAFSHSQANTAEINLIANIISWAKKPQELPIVRPAEMVSITSTINNHMDNDAANTRLKIYSPNRSIVVNEQVLSGLIPAGGSSDITTQFAVPANEPLGVYRADYVLLDAQGAMVQPQTENDSGRFVVSNPPRVGSPDKPIWFAVTTTSQDVPLDAPFDYTFHVYNNSNETRHLTIRSVFGHTKKPHTWNITAQPRTVATVTGSDIFEDRAYLYDTMRTFLFDESNQEIGRYELSFKGFFPYAYIAVSSNKSVYSNNENVVLRTTTAPWQVGAYNVITMIFGPDNSKVFEDNRTMNLVSGTATIIDMQHHLPVNSNPGSYLVRSEIWQESRLLASAVTSFELPRSQIVVIFDEPQSFKAGSNTLSFNFRNNGRVDIRSGTLNVQFTDPYGRVVYAGLHSFSLSTGEVSTLTIPIFIPTLYFGNYTLTYAQSDETKDGSLVSITIPNSATVGFLLDKPSYRIRETANVYATVINTGKFDLDSLYATLDTFAIDFSNTKIISVPKGQSATINYAITIPEAASGGSHSTELSLILPSGSYLWQATSISIPVSSLVIHYNVANVVNPGDDVHLLIENTGGVDTEYGTERLSLTDNNGVNIYHGTTSGIVRAGETKSFHGFQIPLQIAHGDVMLNVAVKDSKTGQSTNFIKSLTSSGLETRMQTRTDKDLYLNSETVTDITDIINIGPLVENASFDLLVYKLKAGVGDQFSHFLPRGWLPLSQPTGVASSPDGSIYVADPEEQRVIKIDKNGHFIGELSGARSCWGGHGDLCSPYGVAVGHDGSVYVVENGGDISYYHNRVQKFDANGNFLKTWGSSMWGGEHYGMSRPSGIAVSQDGYVYVSDTDGHRILKYDSEGQFVAVWGSKGTGSGQFIYPQGIAADNNGFIYITDTEDIGYPYARSNRVQKFDRNGNFIRQWGGYGTSDGLFLSPSGIVVDRDGYVYVTDTNSGVNNGHRVQKFDSNGTFIRSWGGQGRSEGKLYNPKGLATDSDGLIYVADSRNSRVQKFTADGDFVNLWGGNGATNGFFVGPQGLGVDANGFLYVADYSNNRIQKFDKNGSYVKQWGSEGTGNGQFHNGPESIAVSGEGFVYAANGSYSDARIQKFNSEGNFLTSWGSLGTGDGQFTGLQRVAVNAGGFVYVSDTGTKRVQKFDSNGTFITKWGSPGNGLGQFNEPRSIATGPDGSVYVADPYSIQKFDSNGMFPLKWGIQGTDDGQFDSIRAIMVDPMGFIYTLDSYPFRVQKFDSAGNFITKWDEGGGDGMDVFYSPTGMVIDTEGFILIADGYSSRIRKLTPFGTEEIFRKNMVFSQSGNSNQQYINDLGTLTASGKYYCEATLKNSLGQILSKSLYPFYATSESTALLISLDKKIYRPGETIRISGEVVNMSDSPLSNHSLSIIQHSVEGSYEVFRNNCALPASGSFPFSATFSALQEGAYALTAMVLNNNVKVVDATEHYEVRVPMLSTEVVCPNVVGEQPFSMDVVIGNTGNIDVAVNLASSIDGQTFALSLAPGASKVITYQQQITQDALYRFTVTGDINAMFEKMVYRGLASSIYSYASAIYPEGRVVIPISVENTGLLDGKITVDVDLQPSGFSLQRDYLVPQWGIATDNLLFDLSEGDYTLTLTSRQTPSASIRSSFSVRKEDKVTMAPIFIGAPEGALITVSTEVTNNGYRNVEGAIQLSISNIQGVIAWHANQAVSLPAREPSIPVPVNLSFSPAALPPGAYTVKVALLNNGGQELASQSMPLNITGGNVRISQMPSPQTVNAGADATFLFKVANTGGREVSAELTLKSGDFINLTRRELINPGEERDVQFAFPIPSDLEEKDYFAEYELRSAGTSIAKGQIKYHVTGINIGVTASLNKEHYRDGETVYLNLVVNQQGGGGSRNLFARANYEDYDGKQSFVLAGSQNLSFDIPLTAITGEKLFYGIYDEGGRSIHLNSLYIYKTGDVITITTNKQVYNQGETVTATIAGNGTGTMTLSAPGPYEETFSFSGSTTKGFVLPTVATAGTYFIEARLATASGEKVTASKPFDIAGISVKVKEAVLDKGKYLPGDTLRLSMRIESNTDIPSATLKVWTVDPEKNLTLIGERQLSLTRAEQVTISSDFPTTITTSGIHKVVYGIYSEQLLLSAGNVSFDAGDGVILGIATDRDHYPLGSEAVAARLSLYGTGEGTLALNVNGATVHTEAVSLNGFTTKTIQLTMSGPGMYALEGVLTAGGLSSKKETKFLSGTNLPDVTADVWGSGTAVGKDGRLKLIASAGNRGKTATTTTALTLHNGNDLLATFSVGELTAGSSQSYEFLWNVLGKAGEHTFVAHVDPQNTLTEFTKENNRATRRIVVPDIALISETDKEGYRTGEQVTISATTINLTAETSYLNLTCTTTVRDPAGAEVYRQSSALSLPPSQSALTSVTWNTGSVTTEGRYTIRQEISSGTDLLAEKTKNVNIRAGNGFTLRVDPASLRIKQGATGLFTVSVDASAGSTGSVTLGIDGLLAGLTTNFSPTTVNPPGISSLSINTTATIPPGTYPINITGEAFIGGERELQITPVTLEVSGFTLQAEPENVSIHQQETATFMVRTTSLNGYEGNIALSDATGSIGGLILTVANPNLAVPGESVVRVQSSKYAPPGTYSIKVTGSDSLASRDIDVSVVVTENGEIVPGFVITPGPGYDNRALVTLMSRNFVEKVEFTAFNTRFGANAVMGDIDGDGEDEIIVAPGPDPMADGRIKVFRKNGALLLEQVVFTTKSGATLAAGDIDGDWREEIVVGAGPGLRNSARIKVLSFDGQRFVDTGIDFVAFPNLYKLGVKLALGDVDGDGVLEIIAGAGPSPVNPARIKVFKIDTSGGMGHWSIASTLSDFVVDFGDWYPYLFGVNVAAGDVDGDGMAEIIAGAGPNPLQKAVVAVYKGDGTFTGTRFEAYPSRDYLFGVNVAARDLDGDGIAEIITGPGPSPFNDSWIRVFRGDGTLLSDGFLAFPESMKSGVKVSTGNVGE